MLAPMFKKDGYDSIVSSQLNSFDRDFIGDGALGLGILGCRLLRELFAEGQEVPTLRGRHLEDAIEVEDAVLVGNQVPQASSRAETEGELLIKDSSLAKHREDLTVALGHVPSGVGQPVSG